MTAETGTLYVVATPIGNLDDMSPRAIRVLQTVTLIAAEDTRHSLPLLQHFGIRTPMQSYHEHNETEVSAALLQRLQQGEAVALISDAGTPLVSDPGYILIRQARAAGIPVVAVPGPSALIAALSVAGLPTDRFVFEGFLPSKVKARQERLRALQDEPRTLVFYESSHRIVASVQDMAAVFGADREAVIARELTKRFEQVAADSLARLCDWLQADANHQKGEFVVLVRGAAVQPSEIDAEGERVLRVLLAAVPVKQAATLAAEITGLRKNALYQRALELGKE